MNPDVVVCGAGVGGLAAACSLGGMGLRVLLVDKQPRPRPIAKGEVLQPGSLRVLRSWGAVRRLRGRGAVRLAELIVRDPYGRPLMGLDYHRLDTPEPWLLAHDYPTILGTLEESLAPTVEVRRGVLVEEPLRAEGGRVAGVRLAEAGRTYDVRAPLVVAADGMSSRLRRAAGIRPRRVEYPHRLLSFDIPDAPDVPEAFTAYVTDRGLRLCYPLPDGRARLYVQVEPDELRGAGPPELAAWCERLLAESPALEPLAEALPANLDSRQFFPVCRFLAPRLSVPGLALVGETAHSVHPMAAQGMNSSIADAECLARHLAAHLGTPGGPAWPIPDEPILADPVSAEPLPAEPIPTEPIPTEPTPTEPVSAGPVPAEPISAEPISAAAVDAALGAYHRERMSNLVHIGRMSHNAARMLTDPTWRGRLLGRRAVRHTGANPRLLDMVTYNMSGLGMRPLSPLDRLHQLGLPDPRARRGRPRRASPK